MYNTLCSTIIPKKAKPSATVSHPNQVQTNNVPQFDLKNSDLFPIDDTDDILINFLNQTDYLNKYEEPQNKMVLTETNKNTSETSQIVPQEKTPTQPIQNFTRTVNNATNKPFIPTMHFPQSNVTINYNFYSE